MSHHHSIRNLLNIKDKNITFDENFCSTETIKKVKAKVFHGTLTYQPKACYACCVMQNKSAEYCNTLGVGTLHGVASMIASFRQKPALDIAGFEAF